jgi:hypothetical protein
MLLVSSSPFYSSFHGFEKEAESELKENIQACELAAD